VSQGKKASAGQGENGMKEKKGLIPIFFASDENYLPYLTVALLSLKEHASKDYHYAVYVLNAGVSDESIKKVKKYESDNLTVEFVDVSAQMEGVKNKEDYRYQFNAQAASLSRRIYKEHGVDLKTLDILRNIYLLTIDSRKVISKISPEQKELLDRLGLGLEV
jgi:hypothetical protein